MMARWLHLFLTLLPWLSNCNYTRTFPTHGIPSVPLRFGVGCISFYSRGTGFCVSAGFAHFGTWSCQGGCHIPSRESKTHQTWRAVWALWEALQCRSMVLNPEWATESSGRPIKVQMLGPIPRVSASVALEWDLRVFISNKFQSEADAAGAEDHTWQQFIQKWSKWASASQRFRYSFASASWANVQTSCRFNFLTSKWWS